MKLFEFAVLFHKKATKEDKDAGKTDTAELIVDVTRILARDEKEATIKAARAIPAGYEDRLDRVEIAIRPF